ncbi:alpha/beta hydrolase family protein [Nocardia acidivorans]|uniref:alpha/beta hydrolase family protein n=1 Tax=Nocardia acidivorans TaxID=404580 RepID=UPI00082B5375|nr:prolyl oligopeptidase family serine peptidase [Nocardia acidivorans]
MSGRRWAVFGTALGVLAAMILAAPEVSAERPVRVREVTLTVDGEQATGRVYEPDGGARDLIVAVHGHAGSAADFPEYMASIAEHTGAALLTMDQRSATGRWRTGEWNVWAGWQDIVAATQWYRGEHPGGRTVLWGWSQGGLTSGLAAAYAPPGTYDYWVDTFGQADDFTSWTEAPLAGPDLRPQIERDAGGCGPATCPAAYAARSPALQASRITVRRTVLLHGTADPLVPITSSLEMRAALATAGKPVSMYTVVSGRDLDGSVGPAGHGLGPVFYESGCVVERLLFDTEPPGPDFLVDAANGVDTAPPPPPNSKCAN